MTELEPVLISALNQYLFCPRRCALMQIEGIWANNEHTVIGSLLHEHADEPGYETDQGVTLLRALPLVSERYGLTGKADIVELHPSQRGFNSAAGVMPSANNCRTASITCFVSSRSRQSIITSRRRLLAA